MLFRIMALGGSVRLIIMKRCMKFDHCSFDSVEVMTKFKVFTKGDKWSDGAVVAR